MKVIKMILFVVLITSCENEGSQNSNNLNMNSLKAIEIQGHRGARGLWPENSLYGFLKSIDLGVDVLEMDVVMTGDGQVLVSHDPYFNASFCLDPEQKEIRSEDENNLFEMSYEEISQYDCGSKIYPRFPDQEKIKVSKPLLSDVIKECLQKDPSIKFNIEIKSYPAWYGIYQPLSIDAYTDSVVNCLSALPYSQYNLQSFDTAILYDLAARYPQIRLSYLVEEKELSPSTAIDLGIKLYAFSPDYKLLNAELVKAYQKQGLKVIPWTVNELEDMKKLISWGVDGIISDYPDKLMGISN
jgi:glycerophosphoryl diester phosphodiesterase